MIDVKVGWEPKTFKAEKVMQINPPKMEKFDDVSNMTYLNEASVLWNLKARYVAKLIYVSKPRSTKYIHLMNSSNKDLITEYYNLDLFGTFLYCHQSIREVPHLHQQGCQDVYC